ncbi:MAG: metal-dependent hydrolase [Candidatus Hodarchaeales archaeon]
MTLFPTHLSLEGLLLWSFLPRSEKAFFKNNIAVFWLVLAFSLLPDIDIFFGNHRGLAHSLIIPVILVIAGMIIHIQYRYRSNSEGKQGFISNQSKKAFYGRSTLYAGFLWIIHILIDLEYPLAIFYPLSDRLYQVNFYYLLDLLPWLFFPVMIIGLEFRVTGISYLKGLTTYFLNIPPSDRPGIFGSRVIAINVEDILLHTLIFVIFFVKVAKPMAPQFSFSNYQKMRRKITFDGYVLGAGLILIIAGTIMGPLIGIENVDTQSIDSTFRISPSVFSPSVALSSESTNYLFQPNTIASINGTLTLQTIETDFDHTLLLSKQNDYSKFITDLSALYSSTPPNTSENIIYFKENYTLLVNELLSNSITMNQTDQYEKNINIQITSQNVMLIGILETWNDTLLSEGVEQTMNSHLTIEVKTSRLINFLIGSGGIILGIILIIISVRLKKYHSSDVT